ncbi:MAG: gamma-glutamyltransferase [candidate division Zixibacteria bacterium]|nr:gamma-glutamyltransferase [Candidatus Tariuqbacter arcticus]
MNDYYSLKLKALLLVLAFTAQTFAAAPRPEMGRNGMVVSASEYASQIGVDILKTGGNAIDAAVATAFALGVVEQYSSGIGGGNFIMIYLAEYDSSIAVDGRETAPGKARRDMYIDKETGLPDSELSRYGILAGGVPGAVASLCLALEKYGSGAVDLQRILAPAIELAENGFIVNRTYYDHLFFAAPLLTRYPASKAIYFKNDSTVYELGDTLVQKDLAWTYRQIAMNGPNAFYTGEIAEKIVRFDKQHKGLITAKDLQNYQAKIRPPIRGTYRGYEIISMPPPSSGGVHLIQMLNILEHFNLPQMGLNSSRYVHTLVEAMKPAFADRAQYLGDSDFADVPIDTLISKGYAEILRNKINFFQPANVSPGDFELETEGHTTHLSVVDRWGNMCAITATVNTTYGSVMTISGTGVILNNEMDDFSAAPGQPNYFGLIGAEANSIQPGKRPLSSMTPTFVLKDGQGLMALGSPGGPRIITAVLQTILNVIDFELDIQEAVAASRVHHQWKPNIVYLEWNFPLDVAENLVAKGHRVKFGYAGSTVEAIYIDRERGLLLGGADPRSEGKAVGY